MTVELVTAVELLRKAQQLIVDRGWDAASATGLSVYNAISIATWGKEVEEISAAEFDGLNVLCDYFSDAIGGIPEIATWELQKGRTPADVYQAFSRAINAASWNETGSPEAA